MTAVAAAYMRKITMFRKTIILWVWHMPGTLIVAIVGTAHVRVAVCSITWGWWFLFGSKTKFTAIKYTLWRLQIDQSLFLNVIWLHNLWTKDQNGKRDHADWYSQNGRQFEQCNLFMVKRFPLTEIGHYEMKIKVTAMRWFSARIFYGANDNGSSGDRSGRGRISERSKECNEVMSTQVCETVHNVQRHNCVCVCLKIVHAFSRVHFSFDVPL